eukprot:CAMPEP_0194066936 /NCGR_PEP_ID=MMETSP0009_2-20130614/86292_1 /TAXON_ID=210454 /ORGANISM="Grammatophora oceanica, Strain CCMP 410" /LENGTH=607 /DNA_ID=CAMNT_0038719931 /DNA_START=52 /DNA_END=1875 /DNA_ORIENTATION=-
MASFNKGTVATMVNDDGIDNVLLESLFYNEIMSMDATSSALSSASSEPADNDGVSEELMAERALLTDFGVPETQLTPMTEPGVQQQPAGTMPLPIIVSHAPNPAAQAPQPVVQPVAVTTVQQPPHQVTLQNVQPLPVRPQPQQPVQQFQPQPQQYIQHPTQHHQPQQYQSHVPPQPQPQPVVNGVTSGVAPHTGVAVPAAPVAPQQPSQATIVRASTPDYGEDAPSDKKQHLISQFTTLANRLGISLAPQIIEQVTTGQPLSPNSAMSVAEAAAAAPPAPLSQPPNMAKRSSSAAAAAAAGGPLYSKRRKKPRLDDCRVRLAELKAEKELLQRHLDQVQNRSKTFDLQRQAASDKMKKLMHEGASPDQLNELLHGFTDMYSDYGRCRHQELVFHLRQLERLVAPTNFTKMGLWTLGQKSEGFYTDLKRNPIAGILRDALDITPAQGRKILSCRLRMQVLQQNLQETLQSLRKLQDVCDRKQKIFKDRLTMCQEILTPEQVVKLVLWIDDNTQVLESVCPGWQSERIQSKKPGAIASTSAATAVQRNALGSVQPPLVQPSSAPSATTTMPSTVPPTTTIPQSTEQIASVPPPVPVVADTQQVRVKEET